MMQTIRTAEPLPENRIKLLWGDGSESVDFRLLGSWLEENSTTNLGAATVDSAGDAAHESGPREWRSRIGKIPVTVA